MPFAQIHMLEGRTEDQKRAVIEKVTQALHEAVGAPKESIRILISEVPKTNWALGERRRKISDAKFSFAAKKGSRCDDGNPFYLCVRRAVACYCPSL